MVESVVPAMNSANATLRGRYLHTLVKFCKAGSIEKELDTFLGNYSTMRLVLPIYNELSNTEEGKQIACRIFQKYMGRYYKTTINAVNKILKRCQKE